MIDPALTLAYLDPFAGSVLVQMIVGGVAGAILFFKYQGRRFLGFFGIRKKTEESDQSEG